MSNPWLSILIPVFNVEQYLYSCLDSVMTQIDSGVEVIVLDDRSTDRSYEQLCAYAKTAPHPITILQHTQNRGLSAARNSLIEAAHGDYLWFVDSDDLIQVAALAKLRTIIQTHTPDLVLCDHQIWRAESGLLPAPANRSDKHYRKGFQGPEEQLLQDQEALFAGIYATGKLHAWSKIAKRSLWTEDLRFPEGRYFEDMVTTPRLALKTNSYYYCAEPWVVYRQRVNSILASFNIKKVDDMILGLEGALPLWKEKHPHMSLLPRYVFIRYAFKIYAFACTELKASGLYTRQLDKKYLQIVLSHLSITKQEIVFTLIAAGDFLRSIKILLILCR